MHCYICDAVMSPEEMSYDRRYEGQRFGPFPPCRACLTFVDEVFNDPLTEEEIDWLLATGEEENPIETTSSEAPEKSP